MLDLERATSRNSLLCLGPQSRKRARMLYPLQCRPSPWPSDVLQPSVQHGRSIPPARLAHSQGNGHVSNGSRSFPAASNTCAQCARKGVHLPKTAPPPPLPHSGDLSLHLTPAWSRPPPDVPKGLEKGTSNDVPPEGSKAEWIREETRVTGSKESTSSPLSL